MRNSRWLKFTSGLLVLLFVINDLGNAAPALDLSAAFRSEIPRVSHIEIPPEMATLEDWYESPRVGDTRLMLHIQDAHAQPEAQARTRDLIQYLNKQYGFKTIFVEGAAEQLDVKWLHPFKNPEENKKWVEEKISSGEMSGIDLALLDGVEGVRALPIETIEGYRNGYQKLRAVYSAEPEVEEFLNFFDSKLDLTASKILDEKTRAILSEWKKFESGHRDFLPFVEKIAKLAKDDLKLDLNAIYSQIEWPQLSRLLVLQRVEKELAEAVPTGQRSKVKGQNHNSKPVNWREQALEEKEIVLNLLRDEQAGSGLIQSLERFDEKNLNLNRITVGDGRQFSSPRALAEQLVEETRRLKIDLRDYPAFLKYAGYLILRGELQPSSLFQELEKLFERLLLEKTNDQRLTTSAKEGVQSSAESVKLIEIYRDSFLLKKLLNLELSREEWQKAISRRNEILPEEMLKSLKSISGQKSEVKVQNDPMLEAISEVFDRAFAFYDASIAREDIFFEKITASLNQNDKAILITGGFHTKGMNEFFREKEISYGTLTPRITNLAPTSLYRSAMMRAGVAETASQPSVPLATNPAVAADMYGQATLPAAIEEVSDAEQQEAMRAFAADLKSLNKWASHDEINDLLIRHNIKNNKRGLDLPRGELTRIVFGEVSDDFQIKFEDIYTAVDLIKYLVVEQHGVLNKFAEKLESLTSAERKNYIDAIVEAAGYYRRFLAAGLVGEAVLSSDVERDTVGNALVKFVPVHINPDSIAADLQILREQQKKLDEATVDGVLDWVRALQSFSSENGSETELFELLQEYEFVLDMLKTGTFKVYAAASERLAGEMERDMDGAAQLKRYNFESYQTATDLIIHLLIHGHAHALRGFLERSSGTDGESYSALIFQGVELIAQARELLNETDVDQDKLLLVLNEGLNPFPDDIGNVASAISQLQTMVRQTESAGGEALLGTMDNWAGRYADFSRSEMREFETVADSLQGLKKHSGPIYYPMAFTDIESVLELAALSQSREFYLNDAFIYGESSGDNLPPEFTVGETQQQVALEIAEFLRGEFVSKSNKQVRSAKVEWLNQEAANLTVLSSDGLGNVIYSDGQSHPLQFQITLTLSAAASARLGTKTIAINYSVGRFQDVIQGPRDVMFMQAPEWGGQYFDKPEAEKEIAERVKVNGLLLVGGNRGLEQSHYFRKIGNSAFASGTTLQIYQRNHDSARSEVRVVNVNTASDLYLALVSGDINDVNLAVQNLEVQNDGIYLVVSPQSVDDEQEIKSKGFVPLSEDMDFIFIGQYFESAAYVVGLPNKIKVSLRSNHLGLNEIYFEAGNSIRLTPDGKVTEAQLRNAGKRLTHFPQKFVLGRRPADMDGRIKTQTEKDAIDEAVRIATEEKARLMKLRERVDGLIAALMQNIQGLGEWNVPPVSLFEVQPFVVQERNLDVLRQIQAANSANMAQLGASWREFGQLHQGWGKSLRDLRKGFDEIGRLAKELDSVDVDGLNQEIQSRAQTLDGLEKKRQEIEARIERFQNQARRLNAHIDLVVADETRSLKEQQAVRAERWMPYKLFWNRWKTAILTVFAFGLVSLFWQLWPKSKLPDRVASASDRAGRLLPNSNFFHVQNVNSQLRTIRLEPESFGHTFYAVYFDKSAVGKYFSIQARDLRGDIANLSYINLGVQGGWPENRRVPQSGIVIFMVEPSANLFTYQINGTPIEKPSDHSAGSKGEAGIQKIKSVGLATASNLVSDQQVLSLNFSAEHPVAKKFNLIAYYSRELKSDGAEFSVLNLKTKTPLYVGPGKAILVDPTLPFAVILGGEKQPYMQPLAIFHLLGDSVEYLENNLDYTELLFMQSIQESHLLSARDARDLGRLRALIGLLWNAQNQDKKLDQQTTEILLWGLSLRFYRGLIDWKELNQTIRDGMSPSDLPQGILDSMQKNRQALVEVKEKFLNDFQDAGKAEKYGSMTILLLETFKAGGGTGLTIEIARQLRQIHAVFENELGLLEPESAEQQMVQSLLNVFEKNMLQRAEKINDEAGVAAIFSDLEMNYIQQVEKLKVELRDLQPVAARFYSYRGKLNELSPDEKIGFKAAEGEFLKGLNQFINLYKQIQILATVGNNLDLNPNDFSLRSRLDTILENRLMRQHLGDNIWGTANSIAQGRFRSLSLRSEARFLEVDASTSTTRRESSLLARNSAIKIFFLALVLNVVWFGFLMSDWNPVNKVQEQSETVFKPIQTKPQIDDELTRSPNRSEMRVFSELVERVISHTHSDGENKAHRKNLVDFFRMMSRGYQQEFLAELQHQAQGLAARKKIKIVLSHENPDPDAIISVIGEAYAQWAALNDQEKEATFVVPLLYGEVPANTLYLVQMLERLLKNDTVPDEQEYGGMLMLRGPPAITGQSAPGTILDLLMQASSPSQQDFLRPSGAIELTLIDFNPSIAPKDLDPLMPAIVRTLDHHTQNVEKAPNMTVEETFIFKNGSASTLAALRAAGLGTYLSRSDLFTQQNVSSISFLEEREAIEAAMSEVPLPLRFLLMLAIMIDTDNFKNDSTVKPVDILVYESLQKSLSVVLLLGSEVIPYRDLVTDFLSNYHLKKDFMQDEPSRTAAEVDAHNRKVLVDLILKGDKKKFFTADGQPFLFSSIDISSFNDIPRTRTVLELALQDVYNQVIRHYGVSEDGKFEGVEQYAFVVVRFALWGDQKVEIHTMRKNLTTNQPGIDGQGLANFMQAAMTTNGQAPLSGTSHKHGFVLLPSTWMQRKQLSGLLEKYSNPQDSSKRSEMRAEVESLAKTIQSEPHIRQRNALFDSLVADMLKPQSAEKFLDGSGPILGIPFYHQSEIPNLISMIAALQELTREDGAPLRVVIIAEPDAQRLLAGIDFDLDPLNPNFKLLKLHKPGLPGEQQSFQGKPWSVRMMMMVASAANNGKGTDLFVGDADISFPHDTQSARSFLNDLQFGEAWSLKRENLLRPAEPDAVEYKALHAMRSWRTDDGPYHFAYELMGGYQMQHGGEFSLRASLIKKLLQADLLHDGIYSLEQQILLSKIPFSAVEQRKRGKWHAKTMPGQVYPKMLRIFYSMFRQADQYFDPNWGLGLREVIRRAPQLTDDLSDQLSRRFGFWFPEVVRKEFLDRFKMIISEIEAEDSSLLDELLLTNSSQIGRDIEETFVENRTGLTGHQKLSLGLESGDPMTDGVVFSSSMWAFVAARSLKMFSQEADSRRKALIMSAYEAFFLLFAMAYGNHFDNLESREALQFVRRTVATDFENAIRAERQRSESREILPASISRRSAIFGGLMALASVAVPTSLLAQQKAEKWRDGERLTYGLGVWGVMAGEYVDTDSSQMIFRGKELSEIKISFDTRRGHAPQAISINANGAIRGHAVQPGRNDGLASTFYLLRYHDENGVLHDSAVIKKLLSVKTQDGKLVLDVELGDREKGASRWKPMSAQIVIYPPDRVDGTLRLDILRSAPQGVKVSQEKFGLMEGLMTEFIATNHSGADSEFEGKEYFDAQAAHFYDSQGRLVLGRNLKKVRDEVPSESGFRLMTAEGSDWMPKKVGGIAAFAVISEKHSPAHQLKRMPIPPTILVVPHQGLYSATGAVTYRKGETNFNSDNVNVALQPENVEQALAKSSSVSIFFMPGASTQSIDRIPSLIQSVRRSEVRGDQDRQLGGAISFPIILGLLGAFTAGSYVAMLATAFTGFAVAALFFLPIYAGARFFWRTVVEEKNFPFQNIQSAFWGEWKLLARVISKNISEIKLWNAVRKTLSAEDLRVQFDQLRKMGLIQPDVRAFFADDKDSIGVRFKFHQKKFDDFVMTSVYSLNLSRVLADGDRVYFEYYDNSQVLSRYRYIVFDQKDLKKAPELLDANRYRAQYREVAALHRSVPTGYLDFMNDHNSNPRRWSLLFAPIAIGLSVYAGYQYVGSDVMDWLALWHDVRQSYVKLLSPLSVEALMGIGVLALAGIVLALVIVDRVFLLIQTLTFMIATVPATLAYALIYYSRIPDLFYFVFSKSGTLKQALLNGLASPSEWDDEVEPEDFDTAETEASDTVRDQIMQVISGYVIGVDDQITYFGNDRNLANDLAQFEPDTYVVISPKNEVLSEIETDLTAMIGEKGFWERPTDRTSVFFDDYAQETLTYVSEFDFSRDQVVVIDPEVEITWEELNTFLIQTTSAGLIVGHSDSFPDNWQNLLRENERFQVIEDDDIVTIYMDDANRSESRMLDPHRDLIQGEIPFREALELAEGEIVGGEYDSASEVLRLVNQYRDPSPQNWFFESEAEREYAQLLSSMSLEQLKAEAQDPEGAIAREFKLYGGWDGVITYMTDPTESERVEGVRDRSNNMTTNWTDLLYQNSPDHLLVPILDEELVKISKRRSFLREMIYRWDTEAKERSADLFKSRSEMRELLGGFLKTLFPAGVVRFTSAADAPHVSVLMGNPDAQTFIEFATRWKEDAYLKGARIIIAGGIGRGTLPLLESAILHYQKSNPELARKLLAWNQKLKAHPADQLFELSAEINEALVVNEILKAEGVHDAMVQLGLPVEENIKLEGQSRTTKENFENISRLIAEIQTQLGLAEIKIQLVTAPWLLRRAHITAENIWKKSDFKITSPAIYEPDMASWDDDRVLAVAGYTLGYPESLIEKYPALSPNSELKGVGDQTAAWNDHQTNPLPLNYAKTDADDDALAQVRAEFYTWLQSNSENLQYDAVENRMRFLNARSEMRLNIGGEEFFDIDDKLYRFLNKYELVSAVDPSEEKEIQRQVEEDMDFMINGDLTLIAVRQDFYNSLKRFRYISEHFTWFYNKYRSHEEVFPGYLDALAHSFESYLTTAFEVKDKEKLKVISVAVFLQVMAIYERFYSELKELEVADFNEDVQNDLLRSVETIVAVVAYSAQISWIKHGNAFEDLQNETMDYAGKFKKAWIVVFKDADSWGRLIDLYDELSTRILSFEEEESPSSLIEKETPKPADSSSVDQEGAAWVEAISPIGAEQVELWNGPFTQAAKVLSDGYQPVLIKTAFNDDRPTKTQHSFFDANKRLMSIAVDAKVMHWLIDFEDILLSINFRLEELRQAPLDGGKVFNLIQDFLTSPGQPALQQSLGLDGALLNDFKLKSIILHLNYLRLLYTKNKVTFYVMRRSNNIPADIFGKLQQVQAQKKRIGVIKFQFLHGWSSRFAAESFTFSVDRAVEIRQSEANSAYLLNAVWELAQKIRWGTDDESGIKAVGLDVHARLEAINSVIQTYAPNELKGRISQLSFWSFHSRGMQIVLSSDESDDDGDSGVFNPEPSYEPGLVPSGMRSEMRDTPNWKALGVADAVKTMLYPGGGVDFSAGLSLARQLPNLTDIYYVDPAYSSQQFPERKAVKGYHYYLYDILANVDSRYFFSAREPFSMEEIIAFQKQFAQTGKVAIPIILPDSGGRTINIHLVASLFETGFQSKIGIPEQVDFILVKNPGTNRRLSQEPSYWNQVVESVQPNGIVAVTFAEIPGQGVDFKPVRDALGEPLFKSSEFSGQGLVWAGQWVVYQKKDSRSESRIYQTAVPFKNLQEALNAVALQIIEQLNSDSRLFTLRMQDADSFQDQKAEMNGGELNFEVGALLSENGKEHVKISYSKDQLDENGVPMIVLEVLASDPKHPMVLYGTANNYTRGFEQEQFYFRGAVKKALDQLESRRLVSGVKPRVLILGAGVGMFAHDLEVLYPEFSYEAVNLEQMKMDAGQWSMASGRRASVDQAREFLERFNRDVTLHDLNQRMPFANESFDLVFLSSGTSPYVADSAGMLEDMYRVVKKDGYLMGRLEGFYFRDMTQQDFFNRFFGSEHVEYQSINPTDFSLGILGDSLFTVRIQKTSTYAPFPKLNVIKRDDSCFLGGGCVYSSTYEIATNRSEAREVDRAFVKSPSENSTPESSLSFEKAYEALVLKLKELTNPEEAAVVIAYGFTNSALDREKQVAMLTVLVGLIGVSRFEKIRKVMREKHADAWGRLQSMVRSPSKNRVIYRTIDATQLSDAKLREGLFNGMKAVWLVNPNQKFHLLAESDVSQDVLKQLDSEVSSWKSQIEIKADNFIIQNRADFVLKANADSFVFSTTQEELLNDRMALPVHETFSQNEADYLEAAILALANLAQQGSLVDRLPPGFEQEGVGRYKLTNSSLGLFLETILADIEALLATAQSA